MAHLVRAKKVDLLMVVHELGLEAPESSTKPQLSEIIVKSSDYNEEVVKNLLAGIVAEREEGDKKILLEEQSRREYELKKLELEMAAKSKTETPTLSSGIKSPDVLKLITKFNNNEEISIYLTLFERQIKRLGVEKENWVTYLLGLLPLEIVNIIGREKEELSNDYEYVKQLLLRQMSDERLFERLWFQQEK